MLNNKYFHTEEVHNFKAAEKIVPFLVDLIKPNSVIDVGCGLGTWLNIFERNNVKKVLGIDGSHLNMKLLKINKEKFIPLNLEGKFNLSEKSDLVISLEVAEHISKENAKSFIDNICTLGDVILFSAAIPFQGGQNHLNEQKPYYWNYYFDNNGYKMFDVLRPIFWEDENVDWWYRQNIMLFSKNEKLNIKLKKLKSFYGMHIVHPILFQNRSIESSQFKNEIDRIEFGKKDFKYYYNLIIQTFIKKLMK